MQPSLTSLAISLLLVNIVFLFTSVSFYGYYTDTFFLILTFALTAFTVRQRIKDKEDKLVNGLLLFCLLPIGIIIYNDLDFHHWGPVHRGTVKSIEKENERSSFIITTVYYQLNDNNEVGPRESKTWVKKTIRYFPLFEWTMVDGAYDQYLEVEERHK